MIGVFGALRVNASAKSTDPCKPLQSTQAYNSLIARFSPCQTTIVLSDLVFCEINSLPHNPEF